MAFVFPKRVKTNVISIFPVSEAKIKRAIDIVGASLALVFCLPLMALLALVLMLLYGGGIFYKHKRIGVGGVEFDCLKFRTMYPDSEKRLEALLSENPELRSEWETRRKIKRDPRIHWVGSILRVSNLDELPQLLNILRGEMSLVGPRPITGEEVAHYGAYFADYVSVKPGLTGLWQVERDCDTTYRERVALDVFYVRNRSLLLDSSILMRTIGVVLFARGSG